MRRRGIWLAVLLLTLLAVTLARQDNKGSVRTVQAQGGDISYGGSVIGSLATVGEPVRYTFVGGAGDLIIARALSSTGALDPLLTLEDADGGVLSTSSDDPYSPQPLDASLSYALPSDGTYTLVVSAEADTQGEYLLQLNGRTEEGDESLEYDVPLPVSVPASGVSTILDFEVTGECVTTLTVTNTTGGTPFTFPFIAKIRNGLGVIVAQVRGGRQIEDRFTFALGSGVYQLELRAEDAITNGQLDVTLTCATQQPTCDVPVPQPLVPPTPTPTPTPPGGVAFQVQEGGELFYNSAAIGAVGEGSPLVQYNFQGLESDLITVQVIGISLGFDPRVVLVAPENSGLFASDDDAFSFNDSDASLSVYLPATGPYTLLVGGEGGQGGSYVIRLLSRPRVIPTVLGFGEGVDISVPDSNQPTPTPTDPSPVGIVIPIGQQPLQVYAFDAQPNCPTTIVVTNDTPGIPYTFPFALTVRDEEGDVVGQIRGGEQTEARLVVAPDSGRFEIELTRYDPNAQGTIQLVSTCAEDAPQCDTFGVEPISTPVPEFRPTLRRSATPTPTLTPTLTDTPVPTPNPCGDGICSIGQDGCGCFNDCANNGEFLRFCGYVTPSITPSRTRIPPTITPSDTATPDITPELCNNQCEPGLGECNDSSECYSDCGFGEDPLCNVTQEPSCGNEICEPSGGENTTTCEADCFCGDGVCIPGDEDDYFCPTDCSNTCNNQCEGGLETCLSDCGSA